jgi:hypothetical protein
MQRVIQSVLAAAILFGQEAGKSRKQKRTTKQLHADLATLGYDGSYNRVAAFARDWKAARQQEQKTCGRGVFVPLAFLPGEAFQFDWSEDWAIIAGERTKLQVAHFKLQRAGVVRQSSGQPAGVSRAHRRRRRGAGRVRASPRFCPLPRTEEHNNGLRLAALSGGRSTQTRSLAQWRAFRRTAACLQGSAAAHAQDAGPRDCQESCVRGRLRHHA